MAYHDDLLAQAVKLVHEDPVSPKQASLRRAVSAAYYSVFHMLIAESTSNWNRANLQAALGRAFDHNLMKTASKGVANSDTFPFAGENPAAVAALRFVGLTFTQLQEQRHFAEYNLTRDLSKTDALAQVQSAQKVFTTWQSIRNEQMAQAYLVSLVVKHRS
jgi:uncharacterized protein (UPF0332 family)